MTREEAIEVYNGLINEKIKEAFEFFVPELRESENCALEFLKAHAIEWIASIEHDISQSIDEGLEGQSPEYERELVRWKKALAWLNKCKDSLHIPETCKENAESFTSLEEAAREHARIDSNHAWWLVNEEEGNDDIMLIRNAFIAGAKWMAEQYKTLGETEIYLEDDGGEPPYTQEWLDLETTEFKIPEGFEPGDKVIVQIRKK